MAYIIYAYIFHGALELVSEWQTNKTARPVMTYTYWRRLCTLHLVSSNNQKESNVNKVLLKRTINNNSQTFTRNKDRKTQRGYLRHRNLNCTSVSHSHSRQLCNTTPHFTYSEYYLRIHFNTSPHFTYGIYYLRIHLSWGFRTCKRMTN